MRVVFRADASIQIGTGHVMRCLTLANELRRRGSHIQFVCRAHSGHLAEMIARQGFLVSLLPKPELPHASNAAKENYSFWLGVHQETDAAQTLEVLNSERPDWLIVDHYGLDAAWEKILRPYAGKIMAIDDLANRPHDCDLLLDQNFSLEEIVNHKGTKDTKKEALKKGCLAQNSSRALGNYKDLVSSPDIPSDSSTAGTSISENSRYKNLVPATCQKLIGPKYALLRPEYARYRTTMNERTGKIKRVLVFVGGSDSDNLTGMVLGALSEKKLAHLEVDVVVGANNPHADEIARQVTSRPHTNIYPPRPHLADLMSRADLAIGAGGVTTWERMCLGLPSIVISIAENQRPACQSLFREELIYYAGFWSDVTAADLTEKVTSLLEDAESLHLLSMNCQKWVDGLGSKRIGEILAPSDPKNLYLRPALKNDALIYHDWANDPTVRQNAFSSAPIPLDAHLDWFEKKLADPDCYMFVLEVNGLSVGQIRFEFQGEEAIVDYSLDRIVRGRGWGSELVRMGATMLNTIRPAVIKGQVKPENLISSAIFMRLGFEEQPLPGGGTHLSIVLLSDKESWINAWLPRLIHVLLGQGHRVLWVHEVDQLRPADFCFYLGCGQIVPPRVLNMFRHNLVVHESDLPLGKGWSPLTWQILEGKSRIPVTLIEAEEKVDTGAIYSQKWITFQGNELVEELRARQAEATIELCVAFAFEYPDSVRLARKQVGEETFYPRRKADHSRLDPDSTIRQQFNLLRVVDNEKYPAFFELNGKEYMLKIEEKM